MKVYPVTTTYKVFFFLIVLLSLVMLPINGWGEGTAQITIDTLNPQKINLTVGRSFIIESPLRIKRVSIVNPEIADAMVLSPKQLYLTGKTTGLTSLTLWVDSTVHSVFDLEVSPDTSRLKEQLYEILPGEDGIQITTTHDSIALSGSVSSTANLSQVLALAEAYAPGKVINMLEVKGVHQVMLEVKIAEMSRELSKRMGINFETISSTGSNFGISLLNNLTSLPVDEGDPLQVSDLVNAIFGFTSDGAEWTVFIDALKEQGLVKVLAEPTLIALSGQEAKFLAGGEFPIPVPQGDDTITIDFKEFGVSLKFIPNVLSSEKINMKIAPEVSELDFTNSVNLSGFIVPSITTRRVATNIELADGQSFAIAGLLKENVREIVSKFPVLGDIPVLGTLFRSSSFQKNETELVVIVTPHLVKPLDMKKQTLPTDQYIEPDDLDFYLLGNIEGKGKTETEESPAPVNMKKEGGMEGDFGNITPE
jgi:pilus assembly protein CpaC